MFIAGLSLAALATYAAPVAIEAAIGSFTLYMNRIFVTTTGGPDGQVVVDINNMSSSAALLVNSTTRWFLPPRLTTTQRNAINNPANGLIIFNSSVGVHQAYNGTSGNLPEYWQNIGTACPSVSILEVENANLESVLDFGAWFHSIGDSDGLNIAAEPSYSLGQTTIGMTTFGIRWSLIVDTNNNRVLSAAEKSLFDDGGLYGTLSLTPTNLWIQLMETGGPKNSSTSRRSILWGVVADNDAMILYICGEIVPWCTDKSAENYDAQANIDDWSCSIPEIATVDLYFSSWSSAVYANSTGENITFSTTINNSNCGNSVNDTATVTATWSTTQGSSPSYMSSYHPYQSANIAGDSATWTVDSTYLNWCSDIPFSVTLYNGYSGQVQVDWSVAINGDTNSSNDNMAQYGTWSSAGGGNYDYAIVSGNSASLSTSAPGNLYPSIVVWWSAYNGCIAGYGIQVSASLPTASASYMTSNGGMMGTAWSYNGSTVTRTYTGTDSMMCSYLANSATYGVTLYGMMATNDNISWNIWPAVGWSNDWSPSNNYTTQNLTRSTPWGGTGGTGGGASYDYGISSGTPSYPTTTAGNNITSTIYPVQAVTACQAGYGIRVTAQLPASASYVWSSGGMMGQMGTYDSMMNTVTWNYTGTDSMMCNYLASSSYAYNITLSSATAYSGNISWSVQAANVGNTDSNSSNNNGTAYLTWTAWGGGTGGWASYDYGISSGTPSYPSTTAGNSLSGTIYIVDAQTACQAWYGVRVVAQLPASASYISSSAGMMWWQWTYDSMMNTVTWNYTGTTACRDLATAMYPYRITLSSATAYSGNISWSVSAANPGNTDSNSSNDNGTQYFTWTAPSGIDLSVITPVIWSTGMNSTDPVTWSIYFSVDAGMSVANDIVVTANLPAWTNYIGSNGTYSGGINAVVRNVWSAASWWPFTIILSSQMWSQSTSAYREFTTSSNDTNLSNNSYLMPFSRY